MLVDTSWGARLTEAESLLSAILPAPGAAELASPDAPAPGTQIPPRIALSRLLLPWTPKVGSRGSPPPQAHAPEADGASASSVSPPVLGGTRRSARLTMNLARAQGRPLRRPRQAQTRLLTLLCRQLAAGAACADVLSVTRVRWPALGSPPRLCTCPGGGPASTPTRPPALSQPQHHIALPGSGGSRPPLPSRGWQREVSTGRGFGL